jgi:glucokinase
LDLAAGDLSAITGQMVSLAADQGDCLAIELLERAAWALGTGIGNLANLINPERFVLGGGVTKSGECFWQYLRLTARQVALPEVSIDIRPAALGDDAPLWGAVALAGICL